MNLNDLMGLAGLNNLGSVRRENSFEQPILALWDRAQDAGPGGVFFAIRGTHRDGHDFLDVACRNDPLAIVVEKTQKVPSWYAGFVMICPDTRKLLARAASIFYDSPSEKMFVVGVTGTSGKTTTTHMIEALLNSTGCPTAVIGTIDQHFRNKVRPADLTTPGVLQLQRRLREFMDEGAQGISMEVSSHSLDQRRIEGVSFDVAVFTNISRDHLDYHGDMERYFLAKAMLFNEVLRASDKAETTAVINMDDPMSKKILVNSGSRVFGISSQKGDLVFSVKEQTLSGMSVSYQFGPDRDELRLPVVGTFNGYNAACAIGVGLAYGLSLSKSIEGLSLFQGVKGRLEAVGNSKGIHVFVDYAHKPDAMDNVLTSLKNLLPRDKKLICVFGCGGDRDKGKRPMMAQIAERFCDHVIVTSDNPRTESPENIVAEILEGFSGPYKSSHVTSEVDRKKAIFKSLNLVETGDVVLIAGKGHENYQILGKEKIHFDDVEVVKEILR